MAASGVSKCTAGAVDVGALAGVRVPVGAVVRVGVRVVGGAVDGVADCAEWATGPVECEAGVAVAAPPDVQAARAVSVSAASGSALIRRMCVPFVQRAPSLNEGKPNPQPANT